MLFSVPHFSVWRIRVAETMINTLAAQTGLRQSHPEI
jgi:hypothetical protein